MSGIKKDPGQCCNTNRGMSIVEATTAPIAHSEHNIDRASRQPGFVEKLLPIGAENAIPTAQLVKLTGFRTARELQKQIEAERLNGALILSKARHGGGYFLPGEGQAGQFEIADYVSTLTARAVGIFKTLSAAKKALEKLDGQTAIDGE